MAALDIEEKPLIACHDHNEEVVAREIVDRLRGGQQVVLVSDAGTPLISDPGYRVVNAVIEAQLGVIPVPGPSAAMAALSVSGMSTDSFLFCGFLPSKKTARRTRLSELSSGVTTLVLYEAPHRVSETLRDIAEVVGATARVVICREMTKRYEQIWRGDASDAARVIETGVVPDRGEFVLLVSSPEVTNDLSASDQRLLEVLLSELSPSSAARVTSEVTGIDRRILYELAMVIKEAKR